MSMPKCGGWGYGMEAGQFLGFSRELQKTALLERIVRLGATDIPNTPRLFMRHRSPQELAGLQKGVEGWWNRRVTDPLLNVAEKGLSKLPGRLQGPARVGARLVAQDPVGMLASNLIPIPGASPTYLAGKRGLEKVIDKVAPLGM